MTRARDELILSHAADYGGARARRVSPFVLEALDLPSTAGTPGAGAVAPTPVQRLAAFDAAAAAPEPPRGPIGEPLSLSFYQVDDYLTCPRKYKYAHVLRVPLAPHHALVYGAALHRAVQLFHQRHARGHVMSEAELDEVLESAWSNEGFVSRDHEEARLRGRPPGAAPVPDGPARARRGHPDLRRARVQLQPRRRPRPRPLGPRRRRADRGRARTGRRVAPVDGRRLTPMSSRRRSGSWAASA